MKKILLTAALSFAGAVSAAPMMIDDFSGDLYTGSATVAADPAGSSSAGYARTADVTSTGATTVTLNTAPTAGTYSHSQDAGVFGYSQIDFDLSGMDLSVGANAFSIELESIDLNGFFGVIVDGVAGVPANLFSTDVLVTNNFALPSFAEILFTDFAGVDFGNVSTVSLFIDGTQQAALDATITTFGTVCSSLSASGGAGAAPTAGNCTPPPVTVAEPTSIALLGLGLSLVGLQAAARRRKQAK